MDQNAAAPEATAQASQAQAQQQTSTAQEASTDLGNEKLYAVIGYIFPFLFFLPLVQDDLKSNQFSRFHANQQLNLLILVVAYMALQNVLFMILYFMWMPIASLIWLGIIVLAVLGVVNALGGQTKELPLIGKFKLLK